MASSGSAALAVGAVSSCRVCRPLVEGLGEELQSALAALERTATTDPIVPLLDDPAAGSAPAANGKENAQQKKAAEKEGRKEKSIRELSVKFVGLFLQASRSKALGGVLSLEHAGRSLLVHQAGVVDDGSLKTKVRRLYDICNVLTSLKMIRKVKLRDTAKPAFEWLGVTPDTRVVFDAETAKARSVRQYGGAAAADAAPVAGAKRAAPGAGGRRVAPKFDTTEVALTRTDTVETVVTLLPLPPALALAQASRAWRAACSRARFDALEGISPAAQARWSTPTFRKILARFGAGLRVIDITHATRLRPVELQLSSVVR